MKYFFYTLSIITIIISCSNHNNNEKNATNKTSTKNEIKQAIEESIIINDTTSKVLKNLNSCNCKFVNPKTKHNADLMFSDGEFIIDTLLKWDNKKALEINSLMLYDFDTIPLEFNKFKNVETLIIGKIDWDTVTITDVFPKLKRLELKGKFLNLAGNPSWLKRIEIIHAKKSKIIGLNSFKQTPNLVKLKMEFSGFDKFPSDLNSLKCLKYFKTEAHQHGTIDLTKINLDNMPCLKFVQFHSWRDNLLGIPQGIDSIESVKIYHTNLTIEEKRKLKRG